MAMAYINGPGGQAGASVRADGTCTVNAGRPTKNSGGRDRKKETQKQAQDVLVLLGGPFWFPWRFYYKRQKIRPLLWYLRENGGVGTIVVSLRLSSVAVRPLWQEEDPRPMR